MTKVEAATSLGDALAVLAWPEHLTDADKENAATRAQDALRALIGTA